MAFDFSTAKTRLGITGTAQDADIQIMLDATLAWAEMYCDRKFMRATETETFTHVSRRTLSLERYPLVSIASITPAIKYHMEADTGLLHLDGHTVQHEVVVQYEGGYVTLPPLLEAAMWPVFDSLWSSMQASGQAASVGGAVKAISSDGSRVEFDTSGGAAIGTDAATGFPSMAINILNSYARKSC